VHLLVKINFIVKNFFNSETLTLQFLLLPPECQWTPLESHHKEIFGQITLWETTSLTRNFVATSISTRLSYLALWFSSSLSHSLILPSHSRPSGDPLGATLSEKMVSSVSCLSVCLSICGPVQSETFPLSSWLPHILSGQRENMADATFTSRSRRGGGSKAFHCSSSNPCHTRWQYFPTLTSCPSHLKFLIPVMKCSNFWRSERCVEMRECRLYHHASHIQCNEQFKFKEHHKNALHSQVFYNATCSLLIRSLFIHCLIIS